MNVTATSGDNASPSPTTRTLVGWVPESTGRGTLSLITTCAFAIFLCTWVVIHPRIYRRTLFHRLYKVVLFLKAIIVPELIAIEGLQEWSQAQKMVKNCAQLTGGRLKLVHAFYIGMLALKYRTPRGARVIWPNQFTWLLEQGLVDWKDHALWDLSAEAIRDKSNADGFVKLVALSQISWFVAQGIMRAVHGLPLCQFESMALSYIPLFSITYFFWWVKPKDIMTPSVVDLPHMLPEQKSTFESMAISSAFDDEGTEQQDSLWNICYLTPRVFQKEAEDDVIQEARIKAIDEVKVKDLKEAKCKTSQDPERRTSKEAEQAAERESDMTKIMKPKPKEIVVACWDPELYYSKTWPIICLFGVSFSGLHLICWNMVFPTSIEQCLWRAAAFTSMFSILIFMQFKKVIFRWGGLLTMISLVSPLLYLLSRFVMIGGVIAAFRASDPAVYDTYVVSTYWVHIL